MSDKATKLTDVLQLFEGIDAAVAEIEKSIGKSPADIEARLTRFSMAVKSKKIALLTGLLKAAENLGVVGPFRLSGRYGVVKLDDSGSISSPPRVLHSENAMPLSTYSSYSVYNLVGNSSRLYQPLCESLIEEIEKAITELAPLSKSVRQTKQKLQRAASGPKKKKKTTRRRGSGS